MTITLKIGASEMKSKIKTNRQWQLELEDTFHSELEVNDTLELREHHDHHTKGDRIPYVVIPIESVDQLILKLLKYKAKYYKKMNVETDYNNEWNNE